MNDLRPALFIIGNLLVFFSIYMLIPAIVDLYYGGNDWVVFVTISSLCFFIGFSKCSNFVFFSIVPMFLNCYSSVLMYRCLSAFV